MTELRYALLRPDEDGNPLRFLTLTELGSLLAEPAEWGVAEFGDLDSLGADPNYWPDRVGVLIRFEEVKPEKTGYRLPRADPQGGDWRHARADGSAITLGEVLE